MCFSMVEMTWCIVEYESKVCWYPWIHRMLSKNSECRRWLTHSLGEYFWIALSYAEGLVLSLRSRSRHSPCESDELMFTNERLLNQKSTQSFCFVSNYEKISKILEWSNFWINSKKRWRSIVIQEYSQHYNNDICTNFSIFNKLQEGQESIRTQHLSSNPINQYDHLSFNW